MNHNTQPKLKIFNTWSFTETLSNLVLEMKTQCSYPQGGDKVMKVIMELRALGSGSVE
jgi:hypothetical protein